MPLFWIIPGVFDLEVLVPFSCWSSSYFPAWKCGGWMPMKWGGKKTEPHVKCFYVTGVKYTSISSSAVQRKAICVISNPPRNWMCCIFTLEGMGEKNKETETLLKENDVLSDHVLLRVQFPSEGGLFYRISLIKYFLGGCPCLFNVWELL